MNKLTTADIKQIHLQQIRNFFYDNEIVTKQQLASAAGISLPACTALLSELLCAGEIIELSPASPQGGRPARQFSLNAHTSHILCLLVQNNKGENSVLANVFDLKGKILKSTTLHPSCIDYAYLVHTIETEISTDRTISAIGVGIPGVVQNGFISICDIASLSNFSLGDALQKAFDRKVFLGNDMNITALGFYLSSTENPIRSAAVLTFSKHIFCGAGFIQDGVVIEGATQFAGELSFLPFGVSRSEQLHQQSSESTFLQIATHAIASVVAVFNPEVLALTGQMVSGVSAQEFSCACERSIPKQHLPHITVLPDMRSFYLHGLFHSTRRQLGCQVKISL